MQVKDVLAFLNELAPYSYQESYDNSGLLVGSPTMEVTGILVALDCIESIVDEAIAQNSNVIVTHHPIIFKGLKRITGSNYIERTVIKAIQHNIALISIHTNLDNMSYGVNKVIADRLQLKNTRILSPKDSTAYKLAVFVPTTHTEILKTALAEAGAGKIGNYDSCSFSTTGEGQFRALDGANPFLGNPNELEKVPETKIEVVVPQHALAQTLQAMRKAHPYEEIAYDIIALSNTNQTIGSGMIGELEQPIDTTTFLNNVKNEFQCGTIRYTHLHTDKIKRVAVCGGSGSFLLRDALREKADIFITGDFKYHEFFDAENRIIIADIGHFESEQYTSHFLVEQLKKNFTNFAVRLTNVNTNPINYL